MEGPFGLLDGHEQVVYGSDAASGLRCIVAIHSTRLGPALGGARCYPYATETDALVDALRLSRAMAYKAACAELDLGGGKAVLIADPATQKTEAMLRAYGRFVEGLGGRYVTACDVGTSPADLAVVRRETRWAAGYDAAEGGSGDSGVLTAYGTFVGLRASAEKAFGSPSLKGRHVAVSGVGKVGRPLAGLLAEEGARLTVADVDESAAAWCAEHLGAEVVGVDRVHTVDADVFSPNALGGVLDDRTIGELQCRVVVGAANNQLAEPRHGDALADVGVLYAPDYVVNAGGLIQVADELHPGGYSLTRVRARVERIAERLHQVFELARADGVSTATAADQVAERRIADVGRLRSFWLPPTRSG